MALPLLTPVFRRRMDPRDTLDLYVKVLQGDEVNAILQPGEVVTSYGIGRTAEAIAAGVLIVATPALAPRYADLVFAWSISIDPEKRALPIFDGVGVTLGMEITFATNLFDREKQYTVGVKVVNK